MLIHSQVWKTLAAKLPPLQGIRPSLKEETHQPMFLMGVGQG